MSKDDPTTGFAAGFERDGKTLMLMVSEKLLSKSAFQKNMEDRYGVYFDPPPDPRALSLDTPSLTTPQFEMPELYLVPDNPDYGFDPNNGFVYDLNTGMIVGQLQPDAEEPATEEPVAEDLEPGDPGDLPPEVLEDEQVDDA